MELPEQPLMPPHSLEWIPLEPLAEIHAYLLSITDKFAFARTCRQARAALAVRPLCGLPVLFAGPITNYSGVYSITYSGTDQVDHLWASGKASAQLRERLKTHFIVHNTYDTDFLRAWTRARNSVKAQQRFERQRLAMAALDLG